MVTCPHCGHTWRPRSTNTTITCSQCGRKVRQTTTILELRVEQSWPEGLVKLETAAPCSICGTQRMFQKVCLVDDAAVLVCRDCLRILTH